jgi:ParB family chromosome partitioning protein
MNKEFIEIDVDIINIRNTMRSDLGNLTTLEQSIKKIGLLCPVIIDKNNNLIVGARRLQACKNAGITSVSAFKIDIDDKSMQALDIQSDENLCRLELSPEDLENHIKAKVLTVKQPKPVGKIIGWFKKLFA